MGGGIAKIGRNGRTNSGYHLKRPQDQRDIFLGNTRSVYLKISQKTLTQVTPQRIIIFDKGILLSSAPFLDFFLTVQRCGNIRSLFKIYSFGNVIFLGKTLYHLFFMFKNPALKIISHSHIHDFIIPVGQQVNVKCFFSHLFYSGVIRFLPSVEMTGVSQNDSVGRGKRPKQDFI